MEGAETGVFRIHIRPKGGLADPTRSFAYCLDQGVLGVGWQVKVPSEGPVNWEMYEDLAIEEYGDAVISRVRYLHDHLRVGDLLWTRDTRGRYYIAQVQSPWEYLDSEEGRNADIVNVVCCQIFPVGQADDVPGGIVARFRPSRVIQSVKSNVLSAYSQRLWNELSGSDDYDPPQNGRRGIFSYLDADSTEDVVFIYLQMQRWVIIPNSRKADTMAYEFYAVHRDTGERAVVQVKTGNTPLNIGDWSDFNERVFLFQTNGLYKGDPTPNTELLSARKIEEFLLANRRIMPASVRRWVEYLEETHE